MRFTPLPTKSAARWGCAPDRHAPLRLPPSVPPRRRVAYDTPPENVLENPIACADHAGISEVDADRTLEHFAHSFFGIFTTLARRLRTSIPKAEVTELLARVDCRMDREKSAGRPS